MRKDHERFADDEHERFGEELREELIAGGATPRDLDPLPGQGERAEQALRTILGVPRESASASPEAASTPQPTDPTQRTGAVEPIRSSRRGRRNVRRAVVAAAVAAAVVAVFVVVHPRNIDPPVHATNPPLLVIGQANPGTIATRGEPAGARLENLADLADQQPTPADLPVQHVAVSAWWASTGEVDGVGSTVLEPVERDSYFQSDATLRAIERRGAPLDEDGRLDSPDSGDTITDESFKSPDPGPGHADRLPTDPERLRARLGENHDPVSCRAASGSCLVGDVVDLFHNYVVGPGLTAALWRVLAGDSTITYLGRTRDRVGREAEAFTTPGADGITQRLLLISPASGAYLGEEVVLTKPSPDFVLDPPAVLSFSALTVAERIAVAQLPPPARP